MSQANVSFHVRRQNHISQPTFDGERLPKVMGDYPQLLGRGSLFPVLEMTGVRVNLLMQYWFLLAVQHGAASADSMDDRTGSG